MRAAAAEIVGQSRLDLGRGRLRGLVQEGLGLHDHAVHAIAALGGLLLDEGALHRMQILARAQSLESDDLRLADVVQRGDAGTHRASVEDYGAGTALTAT